MKICAMGRLGRSVGCLMLLAFAAGCCTPQVETKREEFPWNLSREGFIHELIFPYACARTPRFDDYTPGSYHVGLLDLVKGVKKMRSESSPRIMSLVAYGPIGALWQYDVIAVVEPWDQAPVFFVNHVSMAHARITLKETREVNKEELSARLASLGSVKILKKGAPKNVNNDDLLLIWVDWLSGKEKNFFVTGDAVNEENAVELNKNLSTLIGERTITTYSHSLPDGFPLRN